MAYELAVSFTGTPNAEALHERLQSVLSANYIGVNTSLNLCVVIFTSTPSEADESTAQTEVAAHNPATLTTEQTAAASRLVSYEAAKSAIATQLSNIAADDTTLASSPTSGQILTVLQRMVDREALVWQLFDYLVKDALA